MLVRLLYASRAAGAMDDALIDAILTKSRARNAERGITGILCASPGAGVFLQALEGSRTEVNALYHRIVADSRHRDVTLLEYAEIDERRFASWRMGLVDLKKVNPGTIMRYSERAEVDPFSMRGRSAQALLEELTSTAAIVTRDRG